MSYKEPFTEILRANFLKYTRKAFNSLPKMESPNILELGCGSGTITLDLAKLTNGKITAIDINQDLLNQLDQKLEKEDLTDRVMTKNMDLLNNKFPDNNFDLIWEEGVVQIIGFKKSLATCLRILKENGYLVLGQAIKAVNKNMKHITKSGLKIVDQLNWDDGCWWSDYYEPLEKKIEAVKEGKERPDLFQDIKALEAEIKMIKLNPRSFNCAHFILKKTNTKTEEEIN